LSSFNLAVWLFSYFSFRSILESQNLIFKRHLFPTCRLVLFSYSYTCVIPNFLMPARRINKQSILCKFCDQLREAKILEWNTYMPSRILSYS
jgi:hypothetical protein